jgi:hypothetical protein
MLKTKRLKILSIRISLDNYGKFQMIKLKNVKIVNSDIVVRVIQI